MTFKKSKDDMVCVAATRTPFDVLAVPQGCGHLRSGGAGDENSLDRIALKPELIDEVWWDVVIPPTVRTHIHRLLPDRAC